MEPVSGTIATIGGITSAVGAGAQAAGSIYGAFKGKGGLNNTGLTPLWPEMQSQYLQQLTKGTSPIATGSGLGPTSMRTMQQMAKTGMPTNVGDMFESLLASRQRFDIQGRENILDRFSAMGLRYSKPAMDAAVDYESQLNANYGNILANYVFQAMEAARARQMQASGTGMMAFGNPALALSGGQQPGTGLSTLGQSLSGLGTYLSAFRKEGPSTGAGPYSPLTSPEG